MRKERKTPLKIGHDPNQGDENLYTKLHRSAKKIAHFLLIR